MSIQSDQNLALQKLYILATGSAANSTEMASFNSSIAAGGMGKLEPMVDNYIGAQIRAHGMAATIKTIALNGFGVTLSDAQTQLYVARFAEKGIDTGTEILDFASKITGTVAATLDNRAQASSNFLDTLAAAGKSATFTGHGVTDSVHNLLQNIGGSSTSLANANSGFAALSANLSTTGITGTTADYLAGATVFADANRDGILNTSEWRATTGANGTYEVPNTVAGDKIIVYGGTDLMTGNAYQGALSSPTGTTVINPFTTMIETMVTAGQVSTIFDATTVMKATLGLPLDINLLSYNALAVLASSTATAADKAVALNVQITSQQISNIITQVAAVIDNAPISATLQAGAIAASVAISQAIANGTLHLTSASDIGLVIQAAFIATGTIATPAQVVQIAQVTAASNAAAGSATTVTMLAQATDVAQGAATNALVASALSGNYGTAVSGFTGTALVTADYSVTVGSIAPGVLAPPSVNDIALVAAAAAAAAAAALAAPIATLAYSKDGGLSSASTISVKDANTLRLVATFDKPVTDGTPTITINNGVLAVTAMTKTDTTHYFYDLNVPAGDIAVATVLIGGAHDATSNTTVAAPINAVFSVDNTAPAAPTALSLTASGGTVASNALNATNTNLTATATITAAQATGGNAVLKVGATTISTDASILAGDTSVTFNLGLASTSALQAAVAAGGVATVTLTDAAGNSTVSAVANPTLVVDYSLPTAPTGVALTVVGGTVIPNSLNSTNTNLTATANITAGEATGGSAVLKVGTTTIATDATILVGDSTVTFNLSTASNLALQAAVAAGGVATVTVIDAAGNQVVSTLSNPTLAVDYLAPFTSLTSAIETLNGTGGNDVFTGSRGDGAGPYTFNVGDILDGKAGTADTLYITTGAEASTPADGLWTSVSNFEKVVLNSLGNGAQVMTSGPSFNTAFAANGVDLTVQTLLGAIDVTLTTFTGVANIRSTTIGDGAHTITTGSGVSTVTATGQAAGAQTINGVGLTSATAMINGAGNQVIGTTSGGNLVSVTATVLGAGSQTIQSTSNSDVTVTANAASGAQTVTTAGGNDHVTTSGAAGQTATITTGAGNDVIVSGLSNDLITGGTGADTMTGGGGTDLFQFNANGSVIGTSMDIITDFNVLGADQLLFGSGTTVLLTADATLLVAGSNVNTTAGGLISFHASDSSLAQKIVAIEADLQLDAAGSIAMFIDGGNTYVYYAGQAAGNVDDQLIQLTGITSLVAISGGATTTIS